jgi:hypothetical protein
MQLVLRLASLSACAITLLTGCEPNQLYLVTHTVVGVNAQVNPDQTSGYLVIGYDRTFATVMPRSVEGKKPGTTDAMTALACSSVWVKGITIKRYSESIATGEAAETFAKNLTVNPADTDVSKATAADKKAALKDFFDCFKEQSDTPKGTTP